MDLEPEGKVFVVITLTGSFTEGKGLIFGLFWLTAHLWHVLLPSVTKQCASEHLCPRMLHVVAHQRLLKRLASSEGLLLTSHAAVHLVCLLLWSRAQGVDSCSACFIYLKLSFKRIVFVTCTFHLRASWRARSGVCRACFRHLDGFCSLMIPIYFTCISVPRVHFAQETRKNF